MVEEGEQKERRCCSLTMMTMQQEQNILHFIHLLSFFHLFRASTQHNVHPWLFFFMYVSFSYGGTIINGKWTTYVNPNIHTNIFSIVKWSNILMDWKRRAERHVFNFPLALCSRRSWSCAIYLWRKKAFSPSSFFDFASCREKQKQREKNIYNILLYPT